MKPIEIVEMIKLENPELFGKIPERRAALIIKEVLAQIGKQVGAMDEGVLKIPGFGNFQVKQVERKKDGESEKVMVKRVIFNAAKPKVAAAS